MNAVGITSVGAFTPVGLDAAMTMGSIFTGLQCFDDLAVRGGDDEPLTGAMTPLRATLPAAQRLGLLAQLALRDCVQHADSGEQPLPVLLCAPASDDLPGESSALLDIVLADAALAVDRPSSVVIAGGRAAMISALALVEEKLAGGDWSGCYVVATDSLVQRRRLRRLRGRREVLEPGNLDGFLPGEGAAAVRLEARPRGDVLAWWAGHARSHEEHAANEQRPPAGRGYARAARQAMEQAGIEPAGLAAVAIDASGRHRVFEELAAARSGSPLAAASANVVVVNPALSIGDVGAAAPLLGFATLAFFMARGAIEGPTLALLRSERDDRAAAALVPRSTGAARRG